MYHAFVHTGIFLIESNTRKKTKLTLHLGSLVLIPARNSNTSLLYLHCQKLGLSEIRTYSSALYYFFRGWLNLCSLGIFSCFCCHLLIFFKITFSKILSGTLGQIKKIGVFRVTGLKILGRVGTHMFFLEKKNIILCILKGNSPFKMHKIIFFSIKPEKNCRFHR